MAGCLYTLEWTVVIVPGQHPSFVGWTRFPNGMSPQRCAREENREQDLATRTNRFRCRIGSGARSGICGGEKMDRDLYQVENWSTGV